MRKSLVAGLVAILAAAVPARAEDPTAPAKVRKKILVELYTSQGCDSCPPANDFLGELARQGVRDDRIVPVAFHVDYFNEPWVDPFSSVDHSKRELAYNAVKKRDDLYFTPMMMVDGRYAMLGSNRPEATAAIRKALAERPGAALRLDLPGTGPARSLSVEVAPLVPSIRGRELMVGVTVTEGPISTRVPSGENAGKTLVEPAVVRSFAYQRFKLEGKEPRDFSFPLKLAADSVESRCRVAAFVQDWDDGRIYQAESVPWVEAPKTR